MDENRPLGQYTLWFKIPYDTNIKESTIVFKSKPLPGTYFLLYFDDFISLDVVFCCISLCFVLFHVIFISHLTDTTINKTYIKTYIKSKNKYSVNN